MAEKKKTAKKKTTKPKEPKVIDVIPEEALVPQHIGIIKPIANPEEALQSWKEYQALKEKLKGEGDFVKIKDKMHPTKQFANKLSKFFGLSVTIVKAEQEKIITGTELDDYEFVWHIWSRATAPNGQFRESTGHCASSERDGKFAHLYHDVYATAETRSKNRAILELVGFGEVSAEEIQGKKDSPPTEKAIEELKKITHEAIDLEEEDDPLESKGDIGQIAEALAIQITKELEETHKIEDMKAFKKWLYNYQISTEPPRTYIGKLFGNLSLRAGDVNDLKILHSNLNKAVTKYNTHLKEQAQEKEEKENDDKQGQVFS